MKVILRRVPKTTDLELQDKMMQSWYDVIIENYSPKRPVRVKPLRERKLKSASTTSKHVAKKRSTAG